MVTDREQPTARSGPPSWHALAGARLAIVLPAPSPEPCPHAHGQAVHGPTQQGRGSSTSGVASGLASRLGEVGNQVANAHAHQPIRDTIRDLMRDVPRVVDHGPSLPPRAARG